MRRITRKALLSPLLAAAVVSAGLALTPASASAASPTPISPSFCNGDLCIRVYLPANAPNFSKISVREWAWKYTFYGHFELLVPRFDRPAAVYNSPENTNHKGGTGHWFTVPNNDGRFTAHAWLRTGSSSWSDIGTTGFDGAYI